MIFKIKKGENITSKLQETLDFAVEYYKGHSSFVHDYYEAMLYNIHDECSVYYAPHNSYGEWLSDQVAESDVIAVFSQDENTGDFQLNTYPDNGVSDIVLSF